MVDRGNSKRVRRAIPLAILFACVAACTGSGLSGPDFRPPGESGSPCFTVDLSDGLSGGAEILRLFDCLNRYGAFDELAPLVLHLTSGPREADLRALLNGSLGEVDVGGLLRIAVKLLGDDEAPLQQLTQLYAEAWERDLMPPALDLMRVAAAELQRCERSAEPERCNPLRMMRHTMDTEHADTTGALLTLVLDTLGPDELERLVEGFAELLQSRQNRRDLLDLLEHLTRAPDPAAEPLRPHLLPLVNDDLLIEDLVSHVAKLHRDGQLDDLGADIAWLFSHDADGAFVGFDGTNVLDQLMGSMSGGGGFDGGFLTEEFSLPGGQPTTIIELVLDTFDTLYRNGASVTDIVTDLEDLVDDLCAGTASNELCDLAETMLPPVIATMQNTTDLPHVLLPVLHVVAVRADITDLQNLLTAALDTPPRPPGEPAFDVWGKARFAVAFIAEHNIVDPLLPLLPALVNTELGFAKPLTHDAVALVRYTLSEQEVEPGLLVAPADTGSDLIRGIVADGRGPLDALMAQAGDFLVDPDSLLSWDALTDLGGRLIDTIAAEQLDASGGLSSLLDAEPMWQAAINILADRELRVLLTATEPPGGALSWLHDLIDRGVLDRALNLIASVLDETGAAEFLQ